MPPSTRGARTTTTRSSTRASRTGNGPTTAPTSDPTREEPAMKKMIRNGLVAAAIVVGSFLIVTSARAHKAKHTPQQLKAFEEVFMEQVRVGDLLFHGDDGAQKKLNVRLSRTGTACAMCHPFATDTHPYEFPKFTEQVGQFAALHDIVNWCSE